MGCSSNHVIAIDKLSSMHTFEVRYTQIYKFTSRASLPRSSAAAAKHTRSGGIEERNPHHTEAQIAAKKAAAAKHARSVDIEERDPHHTEAQIAAKEAKDVRASNKGN